VTRKPFYKRLLFSFQRPGEAPPSPLRQESKNIETELLCQLLFKSLSIFFPPDLPAVFMLSAEQASGGYTDYALDCQEPFRFFFVTLFVGNEGGI